MEGTCCKGFTTSPHLAAVAHGLLIASAHCARLISALQQILHLASQLGSIFWRQRPQLLLQIVCVQAYHAIETLLKPQQCICHSGTTNAFVFTCLMQDILWWTKPAS